MGFPNDFPSSFFEAHHAGSERAADLADELITVDDRSSAVAAAGGGSLVLCLVDDPFDFEVFLVIRAPDLGAVLDAEAAQLTPAGLDVNEIAVEQRGAAWPGAKPIVRIGLPVGGFPQLLTGALVQHTQYLGVALFL